MYFVSTGRKLVIVESPAKAKTIGGYLGKDYDVEASVGHIRDLPTPSEMPAEIKKGPFGRFGVDVDNGFEAYYVVDSDKKKKVAELKRLLKDADELCLATDEDREGEAIAWHLLEVLKPKVPVKRMVFHEITKEAIQRAVNNTRDLDTAPGRRPGDPPHPRPPLRLRGLARCCGARSRPGLSAGRVQSVATRLVVERERERMAFVRASYWDVEGDFTPERRPTSQFTARLTPGRRRPGGHRPRLRRRRRAQDTRRSSTSTRRPPAPSPTPSRRRRSASPASQEKPYTRRPSAPFTTSHAPAGGLAQAAPVARRTPCAWRSASTRTATSPTCVPTSTTLSEQPRSPPPASQARDLYGAEYVPAGPALYEKKVKNAQEAHEAIRPAGDRFRTPAQVAGELRGDEFALYELIWKRTVASQMADARGSTATVKLGAHARGRRATVGVHRQRHRHHVPRLPRRLRGGARRRRAAAKRRGGADEERRLPKLSEGVRARRVVRAEADGHETTPAAALHRGDPREGHGGEGDRPPVDLRLDHRHDPGPRLRGHAAATPSSRPGSPSP